jgi:hypothetical protein
VSEYKPLIEGVIEFGSPRVEGVRESGIRRLLVPDGERF